jgi:ribose transport system substrate-binding protein
MSSCSTNLKAFEGEETVNKYTRYIALLLAFTTMLGIAAQCVPAPVPTEPAADEPAAEAPAAEEPAAAEEAVEEPAADVKDKLYFEMTALANLPYFIDHQVGLYFAGEVLGAETKYVGPLDYDMTAMVNAFEQAIAEDPDGINVIGFDDALKPTINKSIEMGIPVVTLDAEVYGSDRLTFLGTGNYNAGRVGAQLLAEAIGGEGKVALITKTGQSNLEERLQGYQDEFAENFPNIEVVQIINDDSDSAKAADGLKAVIQRTPDLAGAGCVEAAGGVGAATAAKELGVAGDLKIVSMDRDDGTLNFIEDGTIYASVAQQSALMTFWGTILMDGLVHNPVPIVSDNEAAGVVPMPESVDTGVVIINQDNAKHFYHVEDPYDFSNIEFTGPEPGETYVEVLALTNLPYFIDHRLGLEFAGEELGVETKFIGPVDYDMTAMVNTMEQTIAENPAGMLIIGFDDALRPAIDKAIDAGIPVVTLDAEVYGSKRLTFLGTGNYNAGRVGAQLLGEAIGGEGKVALITKTGQSNLEERIQGYQDEFAENFPGVEIVQIINDDSDSAKAADGLKAVIQRTPDLAGVGCVEAAGGVGAATAANELGVAGDLKIVSMDRDDGTLKFIEDGVIHASVAQKTALMTYIGTKILYYLNHAPVPIVPDNEAAGIIPVPESVDTGTIVINKDNAHFFYHE